MHLLDSVRPHSNAAYKNQVATKLKFAPTKYTLVTYSLTYLMAYSLSYLIT